MYIVTKYFSIIFLNFHTVTNCLKLDYDNESKLLITYLQTDQDYLFRYLQKKVTPTKI